MAHTNKKTNQTLKAEEAVKLIEKTVSAVTDARIHACAEADGGGKHITLFVERYKPDSPLDPLIKEACTALQEHDWRLITVKVPIGTIEVIIETGK
jgi:2C-methyl-D-erythritol 2,4-cyclodiphosphate synthase|tara:strand:+ start:544 stop:831 length:288 start_codon:yes stop_codon:yes gene_type:complete